jgi:hypothetical protein
LWNNIIELEKQTSYDIAPPPLSTQPVDRVHQTGGGAVQAVQ